MGSETTLSSELVSETDHILRELLGEVLGLSSERTAALEGDHQGLFTGTPDSEERASLFTSSMPVVPPQR